MTETTIGVQTEKSSLAQDGYRIINRSPNGVIETPPGWRILHIGIIIENGITTASDLVYDGNRYEAFSLRLQGSPEDRVRFGKRMHDAGFIEVPANVNMQYVCVTAKSQEQPVTPPR